MASENKNSTSTFQAGIDSITGTIQKAVGSITGSTGDKAEGDLKKDKAQVEHEASRTAARVGNVTATAEGGVSVDHRDRTEGQWNQSVGAAKEAVGGLVGSEDLKAAGRRQNQEGQRQQAAGEVRDLAGGVTDRVAGALGGAAASLAGNTDAQAAYDRQHADGKAQQRGVEASLRSQADAAAAATEQPQK